MSRLLIIIIALFSFTLSSAQTTPKKAIASASIIYHGCSDTHRLMNDNTEIHSSYNYIAGALAWAPTKRISVGYKAGWSKSSEESETDLSKYIQHSFFHGPLVRYYFPLYKNISLFTDAVYTYHSYDPEMIRHQNGQEILSDEYQRAHQFTIDYGFAFSIHSMISVDLKMNLMKYRSVSNYTSSEAGEGSVKTDHDKELDWNLNSFPLSNASIGVRIIFRK